MSEKIKPCKYCGGIGFVERRERSFWDDWAVVCKDPTCEVQPVEMEDSKYSALEKWNKRMENP